MAYPAAAMPGRSAFPHSPDPFAPDVAWLDGLAQHPIFHAGDTPPAPAAGRSSVRARSTLALRGTDLVAAVGSELRIASLAEAKHAAATGASPAERPHRVLAHALPPFPIASIAVNPANRLLAVVGSHQVAVLVLPRSAGSKAQADAAHSRGAARSVTCHAARVGAYYHDEHIGPHARVAKVLWHPWGKDGTSLLILTADGTLREYNVSGDLDEPAQTLALTPPPPPAVGRSDSRAAGPSRFGVGSGAAPGREWDPAVGLALGLSASGAGNSGDWSALTIYGLTRAGDVYGITPFLPAQAQVPAQYLSALSTYTAETSAAASSTSRTSSLRYLSSLLQQRESTAANARDATPAYLRGVTPASGMSLDAGLLAQEPGDDDDGDAEDGEIRVLISTPSGQMPARQGPFLLAPAPHELSEVREAKASDMTVLRVPASPVEDGDTAFAVLAIVSDDGRVDLGVLPSIFPRWGGGARTKARKMGRYGLTDDEDDESFDEDEEGELPAVLIYETIDLGLLADLTSSGLGDASSDPERLERLLGAHAPAFVPDLLYSDTVYVHHSLGAHALCIGTWARDLLDAMNTAADATPGRGLGADGEPQVEDRQGAVARVLHRAEPTQVVWAVKTPGFDAREQRHTPICGLCIISDVYLSYALLAVAAPCTPVALELNMRVPEELEAVAQDHAEHATRGLGDAGPAQGYVSLLGDGPPFAVPSLFRSGSTLPNAPRVIARGGEVEITPDTLRELGTTAERLRDQMRSVVSAGNVVQGRLDLQLREMSRQLERLADVRRRCRGSRADGGESLEARLARVHARQHALVARTDRVLQRLMDAHQPSLSMYERKWFDELAGLAEEIGLKGEADEQPTGLSAQADKLDYQLSHLRPSLMALQAKGHPSSGEGPPGALGSSQLQAMERMLAQEAALLLEARTKARALSAHVAQAAGH